MKNHGCRLPPLGANVPASQTLRINSRGTGSLSRAAGEFGRARTPRIAVLRRPAYALSLKQPWATLVVAGWKTIEVARHLADGTIGIVPYEESTGTHCAFVAKIVEYLGVGLPAVSTPLDSARRYFGAEPAVRFSEFNGESFGRQILSWLDEPPERRRRLARAASDRVQTELDWGAVSKKAIDLSQRVATAAGGRVFFDVRQVRRAGLW